MDKNLPNIHNIYLKTTLILNSMVKPSEYKKIEIRHCDGCDVDSRDFCEEHDRRAGELEWEPN